MAGRPGLTMFPIASTSQPQTWPTLRRLCAIRSVEDKGLLVSDPALRSPETRPAKDGPGYDARLN